MHGFSGYLQCADRPHDAWAQSSLSTRMLCAGSGARALQTALSRWLWALIRPSRTIIRLQSMLQLCGAQQKPDVLSCLQNKVPGPPHRARNALLYLDLEAEDLTKPEVVRLITMAGIDYLP